MDKLQLYDKALDQEASYEANIIWQTNGQWFNWQLKNSLNFNGKSTSRSFFVTTILLCYILAVARLLKTHNLIPKINCSVHFFYTHSPQSMVQRYGESMTKMISTPKTERFLRKLISSFVNSHCRSKQTMPKRRYQKRTLQIILEFHYKCQ